MSYHPKGGATMTPNSDAEMMNSPAGKIRTNMKVSQIDIISNDTGHTAVGNPASNRLDKTTIDRSTIDYKSSENNFQLKTFASTMNGFGASSQQPSSSLPPVGQTPG